MHTGLLRGRDPVTLEESQRLVDLVAGEPVLVSRRPISYVRSPAVPIGVDCALVPAGSARQVRGVGTVLQRSAITGGHVVQGSAYATVSRAGGTARQSWSHYLARPGVIEAIGKVRPGELAGVLAAGSSPLGLREVASRALDQVQRAGGRPGTSRLRSARTSVRWVACDEGQGAVRFGLGRDTLRTVQLTVTDQPVEALAALCEDIALHDWLLTTLLEAVRKAAPGVLARDDVLNRLSPVIDYLLHLWMPDARGDAYSAGVWATLEARPGFSRQWDTVVRRIRDQLSAGAVAALAAVGPRR
ncbi:SCO2521 family protein [Actinoplanes sp. NPDC051494]|uniref:SCO2521 family protein n=1 Tax=Actinoplanes sp. NPDC051494 TaxID=3363907 RepID=UPI003799677A